MQFSTVIPRRPKSINRIALYLFVLFACISFNSQAHSEELSPTVDGNTVTWNHPGWFQLENLLTREIVCEGDEPCTVPDGLYWASLFYEGGGRGSRVEIGFIPELELTDNEFIDSFVVNNLTITWGFGGWYQVKNINLDTPACNGIEPTCTVPASGTYLITHHDIGKRVTVQIGDSTSSPLAQSGITVTGLTISWPDDGWYEVQTEGTYQSICNGTRSCTVAPGTYVVINHTEGIRYPMIVVEGESNQEPTISEATAVALIEQAINALNGRSYDNRLKSAGEINPEQQNLVEVSQTDISADNFTSTLTRFSCSNGGEVQVTLGFSDDADVELLADYDNCQIDNETFNGRVNRFNSRDGYSTFASASSLTSNSKAALDYYYSADNEQLTISNADSSTSATAISNGNLVTIAAGSQLTLTPPSGDAAFSIQVESEPLTYKSSQSGYDSIESGKISIKSFSDGALLVLNADTWHPSLVDVWVQRPDGRDYTLTYPADTWAK